MFKCLRDVPNATKFFFKKDRFYKKQKEVKDGYVVLDEDNEEHVIGREDMYWFNQHFEEVSDIKEVKNIEYNPIQQLIVDILDEYDDHGYILYPELFQNLEQKVKEFIYNQAN